MFKKDFWITFAIAFGLALLIQNFFFPHQTQQQAPVETETGGLVVETVKSGYDLGEAVALKVHNEGSGSIMLPLSCPEFPFSVSLDGKDIPFDGNTSYHCEDFPTSLEVEKTPQLISLEPWTSELFKTPGEYTITVTDSTGTTTTGTVHINEGNFIGNIWHLLFTRPIYNLLIIIAHTFGNSLGMGIVLLTILARLLLLIPTQRAMESQRAMQKIQPKLKELQAKYKNDQQHLSMETMQLMKENKVNPMGSCLPLLFQFPILLALFLVIRQGGSVSYAVHLYPPLAHIQVSEISHIFLGMLNLTQPEIYVLPITLALLQFWQLRMSFKRVQNGPKQQTPSGMPDVSQINTVMTYALPAFIAIAAFSLPSGVALYWLISTLFSIGQQFVVNRERL